MGHKGKDLIDNLDQKLKEDFFKQTTGSRIPPTNWNKGDYDRALNQIKQENPTLAERIINFFTGKKQ